LEGLNGARPFRLYSVYARGGWPIEGARAFSTPKVALQREVKDTKKEGFKQITYLY